VLNRPDRWLTEEILKQVGLTALFLTIASLAYADNITVTTSTIEVTMVEGNTADVTFTFTNGSASEVTLGSSALFASASAVAGDPSDVVTGIGIGSPFTCSGGEMIDPGQNCKFTIVLDTANPAGDTDVDEGVQDWQGGIGYMLPTGSPIDVYSRPFSVTVEDPGFAPTPEPASLFLLATALIGSAIAVGRKRGRGLV